MAGSHGGHREGSGRKPNSVKYATQLAGASDKLAESMPLVVNKLIDLALGVDQLTYVPAGSLYRKDVLRKPKKESEGWREKQEEEDEAGGDIWLDEKGKPVVIDVPQYPQLDPDEPVLIKRVTGVPDFKALAYIWDRLQGKPAQESAPDPEGMDHRRALELAQQARAAYIDPDELPDEDEQAEQYHGA
jgi:hypothetical protein